jgi:hypothetical protein
MGLPGITVRVIKTDKTLVGNLVMQVISSDRDALKGPLQESTHQYNNTFQALKYI